VTRPADLPDFNTPPVVEVVLSIQFDDLIGFRHVDVGPLWDIFRDDFPSVSEHPPLAPEFEIFGHPGSEQPPVLRMSPIAQFFSVPPMPRFWFENDQKTEIVQFQQNRFIHNWKRPDDSVSYPRYERIKNSFIGEFAKFEEFLADRGMAAPIMNQCEISYINHIPVDDDDRARGARLFRFLSDADFPSLGRPEDGSFAVRFGFKDEAGKPIARLRVNAFNAVDAIGRGVIQFGLTVRGRPAEASLAAAANFFDFGREKIVKGFADLTTDEMHATWGKIAQ